jgi:lipopolysaccharide/colanic/teichoic acid biosynthesis glycosyltransferase
VTAWDRPHVDAKRVIDLTVSGLALSIAWPLVAVIALAIKLTSRGPLLFVQQRLGLGGRPFRMYKFRTMVDGAEHMSSGLFSYEDDDRVTRVGRFLRKTSLDELPQLLNVMNGTMAVVGPRPPVVDELGPYEDLPAETRLRFMVKPGITGLAQVSGRNGLTWPEKIEFDNQYARLYAERGILVDIGILWRTAVVVLTARNVIEPKPSDT